jgi:hypothetical protein
MTTCMAGWTDGDMAWTWLGGLVTVLSGCWLLAAGSSCLTSTSDSCHYCYSSIRQITGRPADHHYHPATQAPAPSTEHMVPASVMSIMLRCTIGLRTVRPPIMVAAWCQLLQQCPFRQSYEQVMMGGGQSVRCSGPPVRKMRHGATQ